MPAWSTNAATRTVWDDKVRTLVPGARGPAARRFAPPIAVYSPPLSSTTSPLRSTRAGCR